MKSEKANTVLGVLLFKKSRGILTYITKIEGAVA